jgi:hypothetical protein
VNINPEDTIVRLGRLALYRFNLALTCLEPGCRHRGVIDGERLFFWFATRHQTDEFEKLRKRLVCSACGSRRLAAVATKEPGEDALPSADRASPVMDGFVMGGGRPIPPVRGWPRREEG